MIPKCSLDGGGLRRQAERYAAIAPAVAGHRREPDRLTVDLLPAVDPALVEEVLAVESECCPFFSLGWDPQARRLEVGVSEASDRPALDAIAHALEL